VVPLAFSAVLVMQVVLVSTNEGKLTGRETFIHTAQGVGFRQPGFVCGQHLDRAWIVPGSSQQPGGSAQPHASISLL